MFYVIYKITNQIDGKFYVGSHKTKNLNDEYMGSGKYLKHAQEKYGIENFTKEILFVFDNPNDMYKKESEIVNEDFLASKNTYNLKIGGFGGWDFINSNGLNTTIEQCSRAGKACAKKYNGSPFKNKKHTEKTRKEISEKLKKNPSYGFLGKKHTDEHKTYLSIVMREKQSGNKNSQFGSMWITDGQKNKKINKNDSIPQGWNKGRIVK
jgi:group I intron endonuclease